MISTLDWQWKAYKGAALLLLAACVFGAGTALGLKLKQGQWDASIAEEALAEQRRVVAREREREREDHAAAAASSYFESERQKLEALNADTQAKLRKALQRPISCPGGSIALGDVVVGGDALLELRRAAGQDRVPAAEPAASQPDR